MRRLITATLLTVALLSVLTVSAHAQRSRTPTQTSSTTDALTATQPAAPQPATARAAMPSKKRVMVMDFDYSGLRRWWTGEWDIGRTITTRLFYQLSQTGVYDVLESSLEKTLTEQQDRSFSERRDPATAAKVGKLKSANAVAIGTIMNFDIRVKRENRMIYKATKMKGFVELFVRLVDVETGQVIGTAKALGESKEQENKTWNLTSGENWENKVDATNFEQTVLGEAANNAIEQVVQQLVGYNMTGSFGGVGVGVAMPAAGNAAMPAATRGIGVQQSSQPSNASAGVGVTAAPPSDPSQAVLADISGNSVIINMGSRQGVKVGSFYSVKRFERAVVDPQNKSRVIRRIFREVGRIKITKVDADSADGEITMGKGLQTGDVLELATDATTP
jgi:curli biogenesis system outer membrane secretion channel CsgG